MTRLSLLTAAGALAIGVAATAAAAGGGTEPDNRVAFNRVINMGSASLVVEEVLAELHGVEIVVRCLADAPGLAADVGLRPAEGDMWISYVHVSHFNPQGQMANIAGNNIFGRIRAVDNVFSSMYIFKMTDVDSTRYLNIEVLAYLGNNECYYAGFIEDVPLPELDDGPP